MVSAPKAINRGLREREELVVQGGWNFLDLGWRNASRDQSLDSNPS